MLCVYSAATDEACASEDCSLSVYMGFTGDDRNGVAFQTGFQIHRINQYAISTIFNSIQQQVTAPVCTSQGLPEIDHLRWRAPHRKTKESGKLLVTDWADFTLHKDTVRSAAFHGDLPCQCDSSAFCSCGGLSSNDGVVHVDEASS